MIVGYRVAVGRDEEAGTLRGPELPAARRAIRHAEALEKLSGIADAYLVHDRPIARPVDDSVMMMVEDAPVMLRRSRGYAPAVFKLDTGENTIIATGAHQKNVVAVAHGGRVTLSQHLGDMDTMPVQEVFQHALADLQSVFRTEPTVAACDLHPDYPSTRYAHQTHLPVIPKLTPNVTDVASIAKAAEDAGADAVSLVNTFLAMAIDVETRRPKLSNIVGGLSGPAIRPIAVRMVYECKRTVKIPIVGMGGIANAADALEFIIAGATAVQVGTANFVDPFIWSKLTAGITEYMQRHGIARITDLVGSIDTSTREKEWVSS